MATFMEDYTVDILRPTKHMPEGFELTGEEFNPAVHLQLEPPSFIKDLDFKCVPFPFTAEEQSVRGNLAYTPSFRVLSDEGVAAARRAIAANEHRAQSNNRATRYLRGLGYTSKFHRGLAYCKELNDCLSAIARDRVGPHTMTMNVSHTNVGQVGGTKPVDKWHTDSVDYVMVIILSDMTDMVGGDLRVLQMADASGETFQELTLKGVPEDLVEAAKYGGPGYCIFMQGCRILHTVSAVLSAREPRLSLVNSYMTARPFHEDRTRYHTFTAKGFNDREDILGLEYARHRAWRVQGQLQYISEELPFGATDNCGLSAMLKKAAQELLLAADHLEGLRDDNASWVEDTTESKAETADPSVAAAPVAPRSNLRSKM